MIVLSFQILPLFLASPLFGLQPSLLGLLQVNQPLWSIDWQVHFWRRTNTIVWKIKIQTPDNKISTMGYKILSFSECGSCGLTARKNFPFFNFVFLIQCWKMKTMQKEHTVEARNFGQFCIFEYSAKCLAVQIVTCRGKLYCIVLVLLTV